MFSGAVPWCRPSLRATAKRVLERATYACKTIQPQLGMRHPGGDCSAALSLLSPQIKDGPSYGCGGVGGSRGCPLLRPQHCSCTITYRTQLSKAEQSSSRRTEEENKKGRNCSCTWPNGALGPFTLEAHSQSTMSQAGVPAAAGNGISCLC